MMVSARNYDLGSHASSAAWKHTGWGFGLAGATLVVTGLAVGDTPDAGTNVGTTLAVAGLVTAGVGVLSYVIGTALHRPAAGQLEVSGKVVKRTGPAVQATLPVADVTPRHR